MGVVSFVCCLLAMDLLIHASAFRLGVKKSGIKLPWEKEPLNPVFAKRARLIPPPVYVPELTSQEQKVDIPRAETEGQIRWSRKTSLIPWPIAQDRALARALEAWRIILMDNLQGSMVGKQIEDALAGDPQSPSVEKTISDVLSGKSISTLRARSSSLLTYGRWRKGLTPDAPIFPISEVQAYAYVRELREHNAPRTRATRFLEAVSFAHHLLGADVGNTLKSSRVKGAATVPLVVPKKKTPLTIPQVRFLEHVAISGTGPEAVFCGYVCMILHMRLRWSDGQFCQAEPFTDLHDGKGYLECQLYHHKNAGRQKHAKRLLPAACNLPGLSGVDWATPWLWRRRDQGLAARPGLPTMPAPLSGGGWAQIPLEPSQATTWLREVLRGLAPMANPMDIGTHSLKATWLSILAKAGCDGDLRRLAGYHTDPSAKMALEYSRDAQAPVLMAMDAAATAIDQGLFDPDVSRAKRWPRKGCNSLQAVMQFLANIDAEDFWYQNQCPAFEPDLSQTDDIQEGMGFVGTLSEPYSPSHSDGSWSGVESISSISELSEKPLLGRDLVSSDEEREAEVAAPIVGEELAVSLEQNIDTEVFRHVFSGCCHIARNANTDPDDGDAIQLKCGKLATKNFEKVRLAGNFLPYKCSRCFTDS